MFVVFDKIMKDSFFIIPHNIVGRTFQENPQGQRLYAEKNIAGEGGAKQLAFSKLTAVSIQEQYNVVYYVQLMVLIYGHSVKK